MGQRSACGSRFSAPTVCVPVIELRSLGLVVNAFFLLRYLSVPHTSFLI